MVMGKQCRISIMAVVALMSMFAIRADASLIPSGIEPAVVALGITQQPDPSKPAEWFTEGTGFLYGFLVKGDVDPKKREYEVYLVTAGHVVKEHVAAAKARSTGTPQPGKIEDYDIHIRVNPTNNVSSHVEEFPLPSTATAGQSSWWFSDSADVAVIHINPSVLTQHGLAFAFIPNDENAANIAKLKDLQVTAGDGVFVLGYPMNLAGAEQNYVIVRQGSIARITDMLNGVTPSFLLDAFIFPGNSGSPVLLKPEVVAIAGTKAQASSYLIGLVTSEISYVETAVSNQTGHMRVAFEENSGLAVVIPTDTIDDTIKVWRAQATGATLAPSPAPHLSAPKAGAQ
jgi:hypothetical protein